MTPTSEDLVGKIWTTGRPQEPNSPINALPMKFAGRVIKYTTLKFSCFIHAQPLYRPSNRCLTDVPSVMQLRSLAFCVSRERICIG